MALDDSALLEVIGMLRTADGGELMRRLLGGMLQAVIDAEATAHIGAGPDERTAARTTQRNGSRDKTVTTAAGAAAGASAGVVLGRDQVKRRRGKSDPAAVPLAPQAAAT